MTATEATERPVETREESGEKRRGPLGFVLVAVVALVVGGVVGWALGSSDSDAGSTGPEGVEELLADFVEAWENKDEAAFLEVVTDDYTETFFINQEIGDYLNLTSWTSTLEQAVRGVVVETAGTDPYVVDQSGEVIVTGDGPWYASVQETWDRASGPNTDGMSTYVIVADADGELKVAAWYLVGLEIQDR